MSQVIDKALNLQNDWKAWKAQGKNLTFTPISAGNAGKIQIEVSVSGGMIPDSMLASVAQGLNDATVQATNKVEQAFRAVIVAAKADAKNEAQSIVDSLTG